ncbi:S4 domain protein YaaA [Carnobacterium iners]|uniref:S4 domain protein YaaA n=1 Tax=Carnobacterium iners TaxID=1073423 RepID=A0A1X7MRH4_9LACT|nr:S4 domain-containing protein YaaA [Carnobacterium iners]SEK74370.1 S4 domain protein YaaA [Carnobacterium iners]SMH27449.1 S4 domain protein YaaA [Carnobacterium iners]
MKKNISINNEFITLGQFLKHANIISSGGMAKGYLAENTILVDNELENRRGKKLYPGTVVEIPGEGTFFVQSVHSANKTIKDEH